MTLKLDDLPTLRAFQSGVEQVYHLRDAQAYRTLCERLFEIGFDFPQCLSGLDMEYGLRSVLHLRRLADHAEVTLWFDMPYSEPVCPTVCDLWGGVEWHEREAYDLVGIRYQGHPDLRRILLEEHWTIHPLQRRYDTGGYLIPDWQPKEPPDWEAMDRAQAEAAQAEVEKARQEAEAALEPGPELTAIRALNAAFAEKLRAQGIATVQALAELDDEQVEALAAKLGLRSAAAVKKWREGARQLLHERESSEPPSPTAEPPASSEAPGNDLTRISGIGEAYLKLLAAHGVRSLRQLAALTDEEVARIEEGMNFKGRIEREGWREQAKKLLEDES